MKSKPANPDSTKHTTTKKKYYEDKVTFSKVFDESIDIITQEVEGMKQLLNEFLRFSRMPTPSPRATPIHPLIKDVIRLYEGHEKIYASPLVLILICRTCSWTRIRFVGYSSTCLIMLLMPCLQKVISSSTPGFIPIPGESE